VFELQVGTHLSVDRGLYTHHGIWLGMDRVIHYAGEPGGDMKNSEIAITSLDEFLKGGVLKVRDYPSQFEPHEIIARALLRLGERAYSLLNNNCEHFVTWCRLGDSRSVQVEQGVDAVVHVVKSLFKKK
jgi:hypothetical protein